MQARYASAQQMKRATKQTRKLKTYLRRVSRDIERKSQVNKDNMQGLLVLTKCLLKQQRQDKNKLYSIHDT